jgi:predicted enzyme related to lactoylglutathione lyase
MGPPEAPTTWMTYLATSDADATAAKIKGAGGHLVMEPMDVMDAGRMAVAADPAGAVFGVWRARAFPGAQIVNEPGAMCWNEQVSRDFEGSKAFHAAVFGYEYGDMSGGAVIREPIDHPYGRISTVADDQGAVFSLLGVTPG